MIRQVVNKCKTILGIGSRSEKKSDREIALEKIQAQRVKPWFRDKGDKTHRLNYPLNDKSLVMDLGGYKGDWSSAILARYGSSILIFEPHLKFYSKIVSRFKNDQRVSAYPFGLAARTETVSFSVADNASSIFDKSDHKEKVQLVSIREFLDQHKIDNVDLIKINIEGGEYELLETILENNLANIFKDIQVQFHDFFSDADKRMSEIQAKLAETHELTYKYEFVWENWRRKGSV